MLALPGTVAVRASGLGDEGAPPQEMCGLCHGLDGISRMSKFPRLAGQKATYIEKQLRDFLSRRRNNDGGQMAVIITEIEETQFAEVARYFASLAPPPPLSGEALGDAATLAGRLIEKGDKARSIPACASCHVPSNSGDAHTGASPHTPRLTAQHPDYLAKQLRDFREGRRQNDETGVMTGIAKALTEKEIDALASYLGSLKRKAANVD